MEKDLHGLQEWRDVLGGRNLLARQVVTKLLDGKVVLTLVTTEDGVPAYEMQANFRLADSSPESSHLGVWRPHREWMCLRHLKVWRPQGGPRRTADLDVWRPQRDTSRFT